MSSEEEDELELSSLSEEGSLSELLLLELELLELVTLLDLFFLIFVSDILLPLLCPKSNLASFSFNVLFNSVVLEGRYRYFLFPVHS